ncbi:MAG TPA: DUF1232 domain-containing protein [Thermodesulfobacteriota bacterium]|jgi:uncharacterized membrane protein YkvA (DUF1232 family)|nr:DUF1232 domain-containing protein [Thermodesulfobacteriota bacterium]
MLERIIKKRLSIKQNISLYCALYSDPRVPRIAKWLLWIAVSYIVLPFDLIPDFIPVIGHIDDVVIVPLLLGLALWMIPRKVYEEHRRRIFEEAVE